MIRLYAKVVGVTVILIGVSRVHQHGLNLPREVASQLPSHTGEGLELQETAGRAC